MKLLCLLSPSTCWPKLKQLILYVLVALSRPSIHFNLEVFLLCDYFSNMIYFMTLRESGLLDTRTCIRKDFLCNVQVWISGLNLCILFIIDDLLETCLFNFFLCVASLEAQIVRNSGLTIATHHLCASSRKLS